MWLPRLHCYWINMFATILFIATVSLVLLCNIILEIKIPKLSEVLSSLQRVLIFLILYVIYKNIFFFLLIVIFLIETGFRGWKYLKIGLH